MFDVLAMRFLLTAIFFLILKLTGIIHVSFREKNLRFLILTALCEPCGYFIFETFGVKGTTTVVTGLLLAMSPVVIIILETLFLKEKTTVLALPFDSDYGRCGCCSFQHQQRQKYRLGNYFSGTHHDL